MTDVQKCTKCDRYHFGPCDPKVGDRVYVRRLDVFGRVTSVELFKYTVECESPLPGYIWDGDSTDLGMFK